MKARIQNLCLLPVLIAGFGLLPAGGVTAQTLITVYPFNGIDESNPKCSLVISGGLLYGTSSYGGSATKGTVFAVSTNGTGYTNFYSFTASNPPEPFTNSDGTGPEAGLVLSGNTLYGTARIGGTSGYGTVFKVKTDGTGFTTLHSFTATVDGTNSDGANPYAGLTLAGDTVYGTTFRGGSSGNGTLFRVNTNGTGFTNLHSFTATHTNSFGSATNSDGVNPYGGVVVSGDTVYGTASVGGSSSFGTVFSVNTKGTGFTTLHDFGSFDGSYPSAGLVVSNNLLYGTTAAGGSFDRGTVFRLNTGGGNFTNLYAFSGSENGGTPYAGLILSGNTLYGTTEQGGIYPGYGTVFMLYADGSHFTNLYSFTGGIDGSGPEAGLVLSGEILYGTTTGGGSLGAGTVFGLSLPPPPPLPPELAITFAGAEVILTWPTNATGLTLESTTNLVSPAAWSTVSPPPVVISGLSTVTNPVADAQKFYRLSQ